MSQTNTNTNNGQNWNQNSGRGGRGQGSPNGSDHSNHRNNYRSKLIAKYSFKGKMKDGLISKLRITEIGHRPSQFKKICNALPVFCADKNYGGLDKVLHTRRYKVKESKMTSCQLILTPTNGLPPTTYKLPPSIQTSQKMSTQ